MSARLIALAATVLALVTMAARGSAHAVLVKSTPAARAVLNRPPDRVDLWFSEEIEPAWSGLSVWSASGGRADRQDVSIPPGDPKHLSVTVGPLEPGTYTVRFRVLSVDGHVVESSFPFTVNPKP